MKIITKPIKREEVEAMLPGYFGDMVKAVVDVAIPAIGLDAELHADIEEKMLMSGSMQENLWGINIYPTMTGDDYIEFDSLINIRPYQNNRSRSVEDPGTRKLIVDVVNTLLV